MAEFGGVIAGGVSLETPDAPVTGGGVADFPGGGPPEPSAPPSLVAGEAGRVSPGDVVSLDSRAGSFVVSDSEQAVKREPAASAAISPRSCKKRAIETF
jgi:hypothetical protein